MQTLELETIGKGPAQPIPEEFASNEAMLKQLVAINRKFFEESDADAQMMPGMFIVCANGDIFPVMTRFVDDGPSKDQFMAMMAHYFPIWNVVRYGFFSEVWMASAERVPTRQEEMPSQREDRQEALLTQVEDRDGRVTSVLEMKRDWDTGKVNDFVEAFKDVQFEMGGRFSGLLHD